MAGSSVLVYNCNGSDWRRLQSNIMLLRFRIRVVTKEEYGIPIGLLAAGKGNLVEVPYEGEGFTEPMLVFCNINRAQMTPISEVLRLSKMPATPIKAMMTPTNMVWNSEQLWKALCTERDAIEARKNAPVEEKNESLEEPETETEL